MMKKIAELLEDILHLAFQEEAKGNYRDADTVCVTFNKMAQMMQTTPINAGGFYNTPNATNQELLQMIQQLQFQQQTFSTKFNQLTQQLQAVQQSVGSQKKPTTQAPAQTQDMSVDPNGLNTTMPVQTENLTVETDSADLSL